MSPLGSRTASGLPKPQETQLATAWLSGNRLNAAVATSRKRRRRRSPGLRTETARARPARLRADDHTADSERRSVRRRESSRARRSSCMKAAHHDRSPWVRDMTTVKQSPARCQDAAGSRQRRGARQQHSWQFALGDFDSGEGSYSRIEVVVEIRVLDVASER